jgi:glycosyltransferase involved in cell wall biosynthesis
MRIAFVNQSIDTILPPYQNSVGACTYGVARPLARCCNVLVYGVKHRQFTLEPDSTDPGISLRFLNAQRSDECLYALQSRYKREVHRSSPLSVSQWFYPAFGRQVAIDLQEQDCDVIHVQHASQYLPVIRRFNPRAKIVLHMHAEWFSQSNPANFRHRLQYVDLVTGVSEYVVKRTRRDFPMIADRCEVMHNGFDAAEFPEEKDYAAADGRKERRILYAGAISPHRGVHVLLEAFGIVAARYPDVRLDLVGPQGSYPLGEVFDQRDREMLASVASYYHPSNFGALLRKRLFPASRPIPTYQSSLQALLKPEWANKVYFPGWIGNRAEFVEYYRQADIFVLPSLCNDSFGIPVVEAMAAGVPVVASRSGGVIEIVKDRETGWIVEKNDARGLAKALLRLLQDDGLRETMGRAARCRALKYFTWERRAEQMYRRYQQLCGVNSQPTTRAPEYVMTVQVRRTGTVARARPRG